MDRELEGLPREMVETSLETLSAGRVHSRDHSNPEQGITGFSSGDCCSLSFRTILPHYSGEDGPLES